MAISSIIDRMKELAKFGPYKYTALPENISRDEVQRRAQVWADRHKKAVKLTLAGMALLAIAYFVLEFRHVVATGNTSSCDTPELGFQCEPKISHSWGQYSPYYAVPSEISAAIPEGCEATFAQVLSRHGAREPTAGKSQAYGALIDRIHASVTDYAAPARFLEAYEYALGADELTAFGEQELVNSGVQFYRRYARLARAEGALPPFVRSAGQKRVVDSARKWAEGFHRAREADLDQRGAGAAEDDDDGYPYDILVIPEGREYNNTLSDELCTAFEDGPDEGKAAQAVWLDRFAPAIADRLNAQLPGANLTAEEAIYLMDLCPYETVADAGGRLSPFCGLFAAGEWRSYDYHETLGKWYGYGSGSALGPTRGVGWANELVARLTGRPVEDRTCTNATLDASPATFPLGGGRALYADFSHDNDMSGIYAALGLYNETAAADPTLLPKDTRRGPEETGGYSASWSVPFAARMYVEKLACGGGGGGGEGEGGEEFVRVLVNDRVIPLQNCGADELGRCRLSRYVESLSFARSGGHWDLCFA